MRLCGETASILSNNCVMQITPEALLGNYGGKLGHSQKIVDYARELMQKYKEDFSGANPSTVAGACLYLAGTLKGEKRTQRAVGDVAGTTEVTIRNGAKRLLDKYNDLDEKYFLEKFKRDKFSVKD